MDTTKIKVGTLTLTEVRNVDLPQEFAAWHQTVRIEPGTYDVFAYLQWSDGGYRISSLSAQCEGITISSNFRSHMFGQWGKSDNNCNGQRATTHIRLPTYGQVGESSALLAQATLCDAIVRTEWDPREHNPASTSSRMWRLTWNRDRKPIIIERSRYSGGLSIAAFEDDRRFTVDGVEMSPLETKTLRLHLLHLHDVDHSPSARRSAAGRFRTSALFRSPVSHSSRSAASPSSRSHIHIYIHIHIKDPLMTKPAYSLSDRDKTPNTSGWGYTFHHTAPQRHVSCAKGDMLAPRSADDIPPITPEAMASVQQALALLANLLGDRDHNLFLGNADHDGQCTDAAKHVALIADGLSGILRVVDASPKENYGNPPFR